MSILDIFSNHLLINAVISWAIAQVLKTIIYAIVNKTLDLKRIVGDGGMPSGHSATVTCLAITAALEYGFDSPVFAIAGVLAIIVMHDAMGVRLEAGKHAKLLNELWETVMSELNKDVSTEERLKEFLGHTPSQVVCGALLGLVVALILG